MISQHSKEKIYLHSPIGIKHGFFVCSARYECSSQNCGVHIGSGVSESLEEARAKALSELIERYSFSGACLQLRSTQKYLFEGNLKQFKLFPSNQTDAPSIQKIFSSGCRNNVDNSVADAITEAIERVHLRRWCDSVQKSISEVSCYRVMHLTEIEGSAVWRYLHGKKINLIVSWFNSPLSVPCVILMAQDNNTGTFLLSSASGATSLHAINRAALDIAKMLLVEEKVDAWKFNMGFRHNNDLLKKLDLFSQSHALDMNLHEIALMRDATITGQTNFQLEVLVRTTSLSQSLKMYPIGISNEQLELIPTLVKIENLALCTQSRILLECFT